jgi:amino acid transporter
LANYKKNSISLIGAVGLGLGVMIGAGIFALAGQVAELAGAWFPLIFIIGGIVTAFSAYSYVKLSNAFPSAGGIGMFLVKQYGKTTAAAGGALLMAFSMSINQSLVARTFGTYTLQLFGSGLPGYLVPLLGVGLLVAAFIVNISGTKFIQTFTSLMSVLKIAGLAIFAIAGLWLAGFTFEPATAQTGGGSAANPAFTGFIAAVALTVLAFKGFTTITNSGSEITHPNKNVGRAIVVAIAVSMVVYLLVTWAISANLALPEIISAKDYALAEAAKPAFGSFGLVFTVIIAIIATISGVIASVFAVSRMLAMISEMKLVPHSHFGMPGDIQKHTLVYTVVVAIVLTVLFDLSRIASMGAILYLMMDMMIHYGLFKKLRGKVNAKPAVAIAAFVLDAVVLAAFVWVKAASDWLVVAVSAVFIALIFIGEHFFVKKQDFGKSDHGEMEE